jgi:hypothetical protein
MISSSADSCCVTIIGYKLPCDLLIFLTSHPMLGISIFNRHNSRNQTSPARPKHHYLPPNSSNTMSQSDTCAEWAKSFGLAVLCLVMGFLLCATLIVAHSAHKYPKLVALRRARQEYERQLINSFNQPETTSPQES